MIKRDINKIDKYKVTPIFHANIEETKKLISLGAIINIRCTEINLTPLMWARMQNQTEKEKLLIKAGAY